MLWARALVNSYARYLCVASLVCRLELESTRFKFSLFIKPITHAEGCATCDL